MTPLFILRACDKLVRLVDHHALSGGKSTEKMRKPTQAEKCGGLVACRLPHVTTRVCVYLLVLLEGIPECVQALGLVGVDLSQRRRHHFQVLLIISHLGHWDAVQVVWKQTQRKH